MSAEVRMKTDQDLLRCAAGRFGVDQSFSVIGNGHINDTYVSEDGLYVMQRINTEVFTDPQALMDNIALVTDHLQRKGFALHEDTDRTVLRFCKANNGALYVEEEGLSFRMMHYIRGSAVIEQGSCSRQDLMECGRGFGRFLYRLSDLDASLLKETIPDFHNTPKRLDDLQDAAARDVCGRVRSVKNELDFAMCYADRTALIVSGLADGSIPLCVTHNDTKINNILFDRNTGRALCVIDLDTVMSGSRLYDYGDALRTAAAAAAEDERDLDKVRVDLDAVKAFSEGFLAELGDDLTEAERRMLPFSFLLMTLECGIRFLEDYLRGDVYFKTAGPDHNLVRARNQFEMVKKIEEVLPRLEIFIRTT